MVCKEDVVSWFKGLKSHTRIDVMCNLFNLCVPFELRFLGTCLEDLGKRDFHDLRTTETSANNPSELSSPDLQCISDKRARNKLVLYLPLLHSCNYACSNGFYKILSNIEEVNNLIKSNSVSSADDDVLEELLLLYTLALNHPAFTFEQKLYLGEVFTKLQQEEDRRQCVKRTRSLQGSSGMEPIDKIQMPAYQPCSSPDQVPMHPPNNTGHCTPITPAALTGDPLVSMPEPLMGYLPYSLMGFHPTMMLPPPPPDQRSPIVSRTNSPCQSNSPSRAGSPGKPKTLPPSFNRPPPPVMDPLRVDQIGKEVPPPMPNAGKINSMGPTSLCVGKLRQMTDEELREQGFNNQSINQFRNLETKLATNGYNLPGKKLPPAEPEPNAHNDISGAGPLRRYNSVDGPLNPPPTPAVPQPQYYYHNICLGPQHCLTCVMGGYRGAQHSKFPPQLVQQLKSISLENDAISLHNSSASDSASDHSPPDTPSLSTTSSERGGLGGGVGPMEVWEEQRLPDTGVVVGGDDRGGRIIPGHGRARGVGRSSRTNPPGIQTLPRGRGHNPPHRRRDTNSANGTLDDRKVFSGSEGGNGGGGVGFPYSNAPLFHPNQFIHGAAYPSFTSQGTVFRLPFHHPNGDMLYPHPLPPPTGQFLPTRPAPPSHLPFSPLVPPPKISCYNCGSQSHIGADCPEATIEEITNKGQYRIDYTNNLYPKPGECSTTQDK